MKNLIRSVTASGLAFAQLLGQVGYITFSGTAFAIPGSALHPELGHGLLGHGIEHGLLEGLSPVGVIWCEGEAQGEKVYQNQDIYNPENMLGYMKDGRQYIASLNEDDPQNPYRRVDLINKIRELVYSIQCIKTQRDYTRGFVWNEWRRYIVEARTPESYAQDKYFQDIYDNVDTYTTKELLKTLKELKQFWDYM